MQQTTFTDRLYKMFKKHPVTFVILSINVVMAFVVIVLSGSIFRFNQTVLINLGAIVPSYISQGEYYRLFTAMFLHGSVIHILMNGYFLYIIGGFVEDLLGKYKYIIIYFISGLGSSLLVWLMWVIGISDNVVTIGASGALFGLMGSLLMLTYKRPLLFTPYGIRSIRSLVVMNIIFTFLFPNISVFGHLGGFLTGVAIIYLMMPDQMKRPETQYYGSNQSSHNGNYVIDAEDVTDDDIYYTN